MKVRHAVVCLALLSLVAAARAGEPYRWRSVEIVGGGFVPGIVTHPTEKGLMYARTDIGGAYRRDSVDSPWVPLTDWVTQENWTYTGIESIAVDPRDANRVYMAVGSYTNDWSGPGAILRSADRGNTWDIRPMTFKMGGNEDGRGNGERLAVDPNDGAILFFGSRRDGLWRSGDRGVSWSKVSTFPDTSDSNGIGIVFVLPDLKSGRAGAATPTIYAGVSSKRTNLYRSTDAGKTWAPVAGQPAGYVPHHAAWGDRGALFITYGNGPGPSDVTDGAVYQLDTKSDAWTNVSPIKPKADDKFGYAGVTVDPQRPGVVMVSTLNRWAKVDDIFRSIDGGASWTGLRERSRRDSSLAPWLKFATPDAPMGHWIADIEIDPFDSDRLLYVTGWGIWESRDLTAADKGGPTHWTVAAKGINEGVINEVLSPPAGEARVLSVMWDIDGFRHIELDKSPPSGFFKPHYGRNTSIDFAELKPDVVVRVYGGQNMGGTEPGGTCGSYSLDNGVTWKAFEGKPAQLGRGDGTVAVSADGGAFVWTPERQPPHVSRDRGKTWSACGGLPPRLRVVADRADADAFYAFDPSDGTAYRSADSGATFTKAATGLPRGEAYLRAAPRHAGHVWLVTTKGVFLSTDAGKSFAPVPGPESARRIGFGKAAPGSEYPAVYLVGRVAGTYGFYRSLDRGQTWVRINDDKHQFAEITAITGDPRLFGRVYLASRNRGVLYGEPAAATPE